MSGTPTKIQINDLNKKQYEFFRSIVDTPASETKHHVIRASRQSGKTFLLLRLILTFAFSKPKQKGAVISASFKQYNKLWDDLLEITPENEIKVINKYVNKIILKNGTEITFFTAKNYDSIRGFTGDFLICDEVALYPNHSLDIINACLDSKKNSKAVFASTPQGKNDFYYLCIRGMDKSPFVKHYKMSYLDNPYYDLRSVEEKKKTMVESIFKSEYLAEFVFGTSSVFGEFTQYQVIKDWSDPIKGQSYFGAIDVSGAGEDSTILTILDSKGKVVFMYECVSGNIPEQVNELTFHINRYNNAFIKGECNGLGLGLVEMLQLKCQNVSKFWMSNKSKNDLVSRTKKALFNKTLVLPHIDLYPKLDNEMMAFIVTRTNTGMLTYRHEVGFHDDAVDSLMIANYTRELFVNSTEPEIDENPINLTPTGKELRELEEEASDFYFEDDEY